MKSNYCCDGVRLKIAMHFQIHCINRDSPVLKWDTLIVQTFGLLSQPAKFAGWFVFKKTLDALWKWGITVCISSEFMSQSLNLLESGSLIPTRLDSCYVFIRLGRIGGRETPHRNMQKVFASLNGSGIKSVHFYTP